ncbi:MAG: 3-deoxy-manno-octulosonate cytidylyltransferase [Bacteroidales bacterium]|nr:3-deoxy-manno-octulosonate cytidylyltransferase [Bacteroidales bacterium]
MKYIGIIPARYASTRFPGKALAMIAGKMMIERVYEQASKSLDHVYVATDDQRIYHAVEQFGGKVVLTSADHKSGTDRCAEAIKTIESAENTGYDIVINIQGDEPFIQPAQIKKLMTCFAGPDDCIATLVKPFTNKDELFDPNKVKVIADKKGHAIYFSRAVIPFLRNVEKQDDWISNHCFYLHIGIYAYKKDILARITKLPPSELEVAESLEQLRWIENGFRIKLDVTEYDSIGIDTPEDLVRIRNRWTGG